ncbi:MAG: LEA type 2 family protein [Chitinophagaceae bacterium]|nr:LEA type 2 family protein [Chitinophagaceae bacterium]
MKLLSRLFLAPLLLSVLLFSCGKIKEPDFKGIGNLRLDKFGFNSSSFSVDLHYFNPNRSGLQLKAAEGDAWMDGRYVGHFTMDTLIHIRGNSDFQLPIHFQGEMGPLFKNSLAAMMGKQSLLKVEGKARIGKSGIFIKYPIRYEGSHNFVDLLK